MSNGMFYCPRCGQQSAIRQNDYDLADCGYDGTGIVSNYTCTLCNSEIEVTTVDDNDN